MGLDQFVYFVRKEDAIDDFTYKDIVGKYTREDIYWRKNHDLQGWMENLYQEKGGTGVFNCVNVRLTEEDVLRLKNDIINRKLPRTGGFFFGNCPYDDDQAEEDLKDVETMLSAIEDGFAIYYSSWW